VRLIHFVTLSTRLFWSWYATIGSPSRPIAIVVSAANVLAIAVEIAEVHATLLHRDTLTTEAAESR
jgi:hypothetical protein